MIDNDKPPYHGVVLFHKTKSHAQSYDELKVPNAVIL